MTAPTSTARSSPLAIVAVALSAGSIVPFPVVGGLAGAVLGAAAGVSARRAGGARSTALADTAVGLGLVLGAVPMLVFGLVRADDWGWWPLWLTVGHVALVGGLVGYGRAGGRRVFTGAALGVGGVIALTVAVVGALALVLLGLAAVFEAAGG